MHLAGGAEAAYNIPIAHWLDGPLSATALRGALAAVIERHAVLRTTYEMDGEGGFVQRVRATPNGDALLREMSAADDEAAKALAEADSSVGFDLLGDGGVLRSTLVRIRPERHLLLLNVHHIAFDGGSTSVLLSELGALYQSLSAGRAVKDAALPELKVQYVDYALWQRNELKDALGTHRAYWREHLREGVLPVLELPTDFPRPAAQTFNGDAVSVSVAAGDTAKLEALARSHGCTLYQAVLALWALLLCRHAGQEEVVIGSPYHGRDAEGTEALIGYFVNVLALRIDAPRGGTVGDLLRSAREAAIGGMRHAALSFQQIVHELLPRRMHDASRNAVFQTMLAWGMQTGEINSPDIFSLGREIEITPLARGKSTFAKVDATLFAAVGSESCVEGCIEFNTDLFVHKTIERISARFEVLAAAFANASTELFPWSLTFLDSNETALLNQFERYSPQMKIPEGMLSDSLMSYTQSGSRDQPFSITSGRTMGYDELRDYSEAVAAALLQSGTQAGDCVGIVLTRSVWIPVAAFGIFISGGAYVPLDPSVPGQRLEMVCTDALIKVLLTTKELGKSVNWSPQTTQLSLDQLTRSSSRSVWPTRLPDDLAYVIFTSGSSGRPKVWTPCQLQCMPFIH